MAKKKAKNKKAKKLDGWIRQHALLSAVVVVLLLVLGVFGYNKYLDWRNVEDMKQLLADFEQLERNVEAETGEKFYIQSTCEGVGKFAESYKCGVYLDTEAEKKSVNYPIQHFSSFWVEDNRCRVVEAEDARLLGAFSCTVSVRDANREKSEDIFYQYDTSPGRPF